jgi:hypothetical protein
MKTTEARRGPKKGALDLTGLSRCTEEARQAALAADPGPADPSQLPDLVDRLQASRARLPPPYRAGVLEPFLSALSHLGPAGFEQVLARDPSREGMALVMLDIAQAILQNGERYQETATDAFEEVVSDLYDGFLSASDRRGIRRPDKHVLAPLVKWGKPDFGPYTIPVDATRYFGIQTAVVSLPPSHATRGILAWPALAHETAGHDVLHATDGLVNEVARLLRAELARDTRLKAAGLPRYWAERVDETASDVLGILNMGPIAGIALVGYFRALNAAYGGKPQLRANGPASDPHPADLLRGYLAAKVVALLEFSLRSSWSASIAAELEKDVPSSGQMRIGSQVISVELGRRSAERVAEILVSRPLQSLDQHALGDIQTWRDSDQQIVEGLIPALSDASSTPPAVASGLYAAHAVAAAVSAALSTESDLGSLFSRMRDLLKLMHDRNPSWGPLFVAHPGDLLRCPARRAYG